MSLPYISDYAKSNKAVCRGCEINIVKNTLRIAIMLQSRHFDGIVPNWFHFHCFFIEHMPDSTHEIEGFSALKWEEQKEIETIIANGESPYAGEDKKHEMKKAISFANSKALLHEYEIDNAKNSVTKCEFCNAKINKSDIRIKKKLAKPLWYHLRCFEKIHTQVDFLECGDKMDGFNILSQEDQLTVLETLPGIAEEKVVPAKKIRLSTDELTMSPEDLIKKRNLDIMHKYREELKENLKREELVLLLEHNRQLAPNNMDLILDRASDMLTFGALERCRKCTSGQLVFTDGGYKCARGPSSTWSKCKVIKNPNRMFVDIPLELKLRHDCLYQYEYVERRREAPKKRKAKKVTNGPLKTMNLILLGFDNEEKSALHSIIKSLSGRVVSEVRRSVFAIIATEDEVNNNSDDIQLSKDRFVYVVSKDFLYEILEKEGEEEPELWTLDELARKHSLVDWGCELHNRIPNKFSQGKYSSMNSSRLEQEEREGKRRMVVKGGIAIEPDSGLENIAHVYQSGDCKFNAVLGRANYESNQNTYYKIQLLEADASEEYWVYRSWGRIGTSVGSFNVKKMDSLAEAKVEFKNTFQKMTGHTWEMRHGMHVRKGAYTLVDVNYDIRQEEITDLCQYVAESTLNPAVAELMAIIFNVQAMEKMMLEYQLDLNKMPLGKLSRSQIKIAYEILGQATWALKQKKKNKRLIIDITNQFYSHMPHNSALARPPLLDNLSLLKKKSDMLADLMELETAYAMLQRGAAGEGGNILDGYYNQLNTDIEVIHERSDEFKLIQEYVTNTHADTHRNYDLKILEIFKIKRNGEEERYNPHKNLNNRRLLWHGSRTTNYAGILSQGLRIAPPEAPQTGYMFGKGIYFADMVSKSANYCSTTLEDSVGLMLLCEVALGNMVDKINAETITSLPDGVNSVRGVGKTEPDTRNMKTLEDGVQIPLGKPVTDIDSNASLLYNEYIVYDVSQVNIKYLLKMDFKFKNRRLY